MNDRPFISVVMPTYNRSHYLANALDALLGQSYPRDRYEIIVVDDASSDRTAEILDGFRQAHPELISTQRQECNRGPAAARNWGVHESRGSLVAFIDDDCVATPDWLEQIARSHNATRTIGVGGSVLPYATDTAVQRYQARYSVIARPGIRDGEVFHLVTANAAFKRAALLEIGGFAEQLTFAGGEDPDLCNRLRALGYRFHYDPEVVVHHRYSPSWRSFARTFYRYGLGTAFHLLRNHDAGFRLLLLSYSSMLVFPYRLHLHWRHKVRGKDLLGFSLLDCIRGCCFLVGLGHGYLTYGQRGKQ